MAILINPFRFASAPSGPTDTGWLFPTSYDESGGDEDWLLPTNVYADDTNYASVDVDDEEASRTLITMGYGFAIPSGATILGVEVEHIRWCIDSDDLYESVERLVVAGSVAGTNKANTSSILPKSETVVTRGSSSDLWGLINGSTITAEICNASTFGFGMAVFEDDRDGRTEANYDYNKMKVHYST